MRAHASLQVIALGCLWFGRMDARAAVTALASPAQIPNAFTINFDNQPAGAAANTLFQDQGVTFTRDDGAAVYLMDWTALSRHTTSPDIVLATIRTFEPIWATHLNVFLNGPVHAMGAFFGNDQWSQDFFAIRMSAYDASNNLLGFVDVTANNNTDVDQFIGLASDVPFDHVRFENLMPFGGASTGFSVVLDDLMFTPALVPQITCPAPLILECSNSVIILSATVANPSGSPLDVVWRVNGMAQQTNEIPAGASASNVSITASFGIGENVVEITASGGTSVLASCSTTVTVRDSTPPEIVRISANPNVLWPPNNKMVLVRVSVAVNDCSPTTCEIVAVRSNEGRASAKRHQKAELDWRITGDLTVSLRAQRLGSGQGRTYIIDVECKDAAGNSSVRSVTVTVPKNHRAKDAR